MRVPIETIKSLGCNSLIITNSAGGINSEYKPGDVILINDHINLTGTSPLIGQTGSGKFIDMSETYDIQQRKIFMDLARKKGFELKRVHIFGFLVLISKLHQKLKWQDY